MDTSPLDRILKRREVLKLCGFSDTTLFRLCRSGAFPKAVRLSERRCGWRESSIRAWLESRVASPLEVPIPKRSHAVAGESAAV